MARAHTSPTVMGGLLALALTPAFWPTDAAAGALCPDTEDVQLTVGQSNDAGEVEVCNGRNPDTDVDFLRVTYQATYPFCLLDTQLHVATIPEPPAEPDDNIPQNPQGRPTAGQFSDFGLPDEGCQGTATYTIPLAEIGEVGVEPEQTIAIAARADLEDEDGKVEEAWGDGTRFTDQGSTPTYFTYVVQSVCPCFYAEFGFSPDLFGQGDDFMEARCDAWGGVSQFAKEVSLRRLDGHGRTLAASEAGDLSSWRCTRVLRTDVFQNEVISSQAVAEQCREDVLDYAKEFAAENPGVVINDPAGCLEP